MHFFTATLVALSALGAAVLAAENPITYPSTGDKLEAGKTIVIKWTPTTDNPTINLILRNGDSGNLDTVGPIATETENDGEYEWTVPDNLPAGSDYAIEIKWEGGENYTPQFVIDSDVTAPTTTATEDSTTTATATESETETATETATETGTETETETATTTETKTETETTTTTEETTSTTEAPTTTNLPSTITPAPNSTISTTTTRTTVKPKTTTTEDDEQDNAPDSSAPGLGKVFSSGLVMLVAAAWALTL